MRHPIALALAVIALGAACEDPESSGPPPFEEAYALGIDQYLGVADPTREVPEEGGVTSYVFDPADGPMCLRGGEFQVAVRETGHQDVVFFLGGGGACWSDFCVAIESAQAGMPRLDVLDPELTTNPVRDWNHVFVSYCDGSLFSGDVDIDDTGNGEIDRYHRGLRNLSAALDVAVDRFPSPRRVLLAGSSGGGYGTIVSTMLVRRVFPDAELVVFNDAGVGIGRPEEPDFMNALVTEFNARQFIPASCVDCFGDGHATPLIEWELARDPDLRVAVFSSYEDAIIAGMFLNIGDAFRGALREETDRIHTSYPDRYKRFFIEGTMHTALLGDVAGFVGEAMAAVVGDAVELGSFETIGPGGVTVGGWLDAFVADDPAWVDAVE